MLAAFHPENRSPHTLASLTMMDANPCPYSVRRRLAMWDSEVGRKARPCYSHWNHWMAPTPHSRDVTALTFTPFINNFRTNFGMLLFGTRRNMKRIFIRAVCRRTCDYIYASSLFVSLQLNFVHSLWYTIKTLSSS